MAIVTVEKHTYKCESLYQWGLNQKLEVYGLSLPSIPEVHFTNAAMGKAIVKQTTMDAAGVIYADVPNSLLQKPYKIIAYICAYSGTEFETLYKIEIPVKERAKPADYTLTNDPEVYSFNALENKVQNVLASYNAVDQKHKDAVAALDAAAKALETAKGAYDDAVASALDAAREAVGKLTAADLNAYSKDEIIPISALEFSDLSRIAYGSYVGTGSSPVTLTADFDIKFAAVVHSTEEYKAFYAVKGQATAHVPYSSGKADLSWQDKSISFTNLTASGVTYYYVFIG